MMRTLSKKIGLQFIITTHLPELIESADNVVMVSKNKEGVSVVSTRKGNI